MLPLPLKIGALFIAVILIVWLARWLSGMAVPLAACLWIAAGIGVLYSSNRLPWIDRFPPIARLVAAYAPRADWAPAPLPPQNGTSGGGLGTKPPPTEAPQPIPDLSRLVGIDGVLAEVDQLIASRKSSRSVGVAPATVVLLIGPRGTGKSSIALALAAKLHRAGALPTDRIVMVSATATPGLSDSYGASAETLQSLAGRAQSSLDGVLLIEDLDWLTSLSSGQTATDVGIRLLDVARRYPGRLFIIASGSPAAAARLDPGKRWLGQLNVRRIDFADLGTDALRVIFTDLLEQQGLRLAPDAERALKVKLDERRQEGGEEFDNAYAVRRLVEDALHRRGLRISGEPQPRSGDDLVTAADVRDAVATI
jgi:ATPase family protein associated with various cellular activities (AAA)/AAA lid domain-containing protein